MPPGLGYGQKTINTGKQQGGTFGPNVKPGLRTAPKPTGFVPGGKNINVGSAEGATQMPGGKKATSSVSGGAPAKAGRKGRMTGGY